MTTPDIITNILVKYNTYISKNREPYYISSIICDNNNRLLINCIGYRGIQWTHKVFLDINDNLIILNERDEKII